MSIGLQEYWGLQDPAEPSSDAAERARLFRASFRCAMGEVNEALQYTAAYAELCRHEPLVAQRDSAYLAYQTVAARIEAAHSTVEDEDIERVLSSVRNLKSVATELKRTTEQAAAAWNALETDLGMKIADLEQWGHEKASTLRQIAETIQSKANARKWREGALILEQVLPKFAPIYEEYCQQKAAWEKYQPAAAALEPQLARAAACQYPSLEPMQTEIIGLAARMREAASGRDFVTARARLDELAAKLGAFETAWVQMETRCAQYMHAWSVLQPQHGQIYHIQLTTQGFVDPEILDLQSRMEQAAESGDYEQAQQLLNQLSAMIDQKLAEMERLAQEQAAEAATEESEEEEEDEGEEEPDEEDQQEEERGWFSSVVDSVVDFVTGDDDEEDEEAEDEKGDDEVEEDEEESGYFESVTDSVVSTVSGAWEATADTASGFIEAAGDTASGAWNSVTDTASGAWETFTDTAADVTHAVTDTAGSWWDSASEVASSGWNEATDSAWEVADSITETTSGWWDSITDTVSGAWDTVTVTADGWWDTVTDTADVWWDSITEAASAANDWVTDLFAEQPTPGWEAGDATGSAIAKQSGDAIKAAKRMTQTFGSRDKAIARARSLKTPAAVIIEEGEYVVYEASLDSNLIWGESLDLDDAANDDTEDNKDTDIERVHAGLVALVTEDGYVIRTDGGGGVIDRTGSPLGPFNAHIQAFGPGLKQIEDQEVFEKQFELVMRDTAFAALDAAEQAAREARAKLDGPKLDAADQATLERVLKDLAPIDKELADKELELLLAKAQLYVEYGRLVTQFGNPLAIPASVLTNLIRSGSPIDIPREEQAKVDKLAAEAAKIRARQSIAARDFPLALRVEDRDEFLGKSPESRMEELRGAADGVIEDVDTTRENIEDGDFDFWTMPGIRETAMAALGLEGQQLEWARDKASWEQGEDTALAVGEAVLAIGLGVGAIFATGGLALVLGGAALAVGGYGAYDVTEEHFRKGSAANIALDPSQGLIPQEDVPHWGWVAAAWIGAGLDAASVASAIKALKAGAELAEVAKIFRVPADQVDDFVKTVLKPALAGKSVRSFKAAMIGDEVFDARYGAEMSEAVTVITRNSKGGFDVEVVARAGTDPALRKAAVLEEMRHLQQLSDPRFADDLGRLTEDALKNWPSKTPLEKMEAFRAQLRLEIDSQESLLKQLGEVPREKQFSVADQIDEAKASLESYQSKLADVEKGLDSGTPPAWLDAAPAPRLFSTPKYETTNKDAFKLTGIKAPEGHYYAKVDGHFQLRRFPEGSPNFRNVIPMRIVKKGNGWALEKGKRLTVAQRRAKVEALNGEVLENPIYAKLEGALDGFPDPFQKAYSRKFKSAFWELEKLGVDPKTVLGGLADKSADAFEQAVRSNLRKAIVGEVNKLPKADRFKQLRRFLDAMPDNGSRGALFTEFRAQSLGKNLRNVEPAVGQTTLAGTKLKGDGIVEVMGKAPGEGKSGKGPKQLGEYLIEDKSSARAFDFDQLENYSKALKRDGVIKTAGKEQKELKGVTYMFPDENAANAAVKALEKPGFSSKIHVAFFKDGKWVWLR